MFFNDVFVPDDDVVGPVDGGWTVARATLGNESVSIGGGSGGDDVSGDALIPMLDAHPERLAGGPSRIGRYIANHQAMAVLNLRSAHRAVAGGEPGPEGNVTKLVLSEIGHEAAAIAAELSGPDGAFMDGQAGDGRAAGARPPRAVDRRRHVGDQAQPDRRAHPRPATRSPGEVARPPRTIEGSRTCEAARVARYAIVPDGSQVLIEATSSVHPINSRTDGLEGFVDLEVDESGRVDTAAAPAGELSLRVERLSSGNPFEDRELRRHVDARRFPTIVGRLTAIHDTDRDGRYTVRGDLTFRGVTNTYEDEMTITRIDDDTLHLDGRSTFDIRDFGMQPPRILMLRVHPEVVVTVSIVARK